MRRRDNAEGFHHEKCEAHETNGRLRALSVRRLGCFVVEIRLYESGSAEAVESDRCRVAARRRTLLRAEIGPMTRADPTCHSVIADII